ncbi:F-box only protein 6-like [Neosynchiropus ocellatus]
MRKKLLKAFYLSSDEPQSESSQEGSSSSLSSRNPFPLEILEEIFLQLPAHDVVRLCRLVCREWKEVVDSQSLWKERCRREGYHPRDASTSPKDWMVFYFCCVMKRNLLKNPRGEDKMKDWVILENGGNEWKLEDVLVPHPDETVKKNFVTSYSMCMKTQLIDLKKEGYGASFMDKFQPDIRVTDWYAPRWDCGSQYKIQVELLNQRKRPIQSFSPEVVYFEQWNDGTWNQMTHAFRKYGPGVRFIRFTHGGKDTQFWAGWYGIRVTESCVELCPTNEG